LNVLIPNSPSISPAELLNNASPYFADLGISQRQQQPVVSPTGELLLSPTPYFSDFGTNQWQQQQPHEQHLHSCIALALRGVFAKMMEQKMQNMSHSWLRLFLGYQLQILLTLTSHYWLSSLELMMM
jgi:hypothetical protein